MGQTTQHYKRTLSGSIGAGMGSLFGGSGKQYYILEHKISSKFHKAGESQEIIVDQIELGRDPRCQVRFDESFTTVSRRHAAIIRETDRWKLVQLSATNETLLNGRSVQREWYLQNGDEIQLAKGGPRLGFIIPTGNKSTVGSIGLSRRLSLFRQQALKPYKTAITVLSVFLCLIVAGSVTWGVISYQEQQKLIEKNQDLAKAIQEGNEQAAKELTEANKKIEGHKKELANLKKRISRITPPLNPDTKTGITPPAGAINECTPFVFAIVLEKVVINFEGSEEIIVVEEPEIVGSGFLLEDGRLVTARHVVEFWYYYHYFNSSDFEAINIYAHNDGKVVAYYIAFSSSGQEFSFTSEQVKCNRRTDKTATEMLDNGRNVVVKRANADETDWAYYQTRETSGLKYDNTLSTNLPIGADLEILGFPQGRGAENLNNISPVYSNCKVSQQGLDVNNTIMVSNDNIEPGNSGGPVLFKHNGVYHVIGLVSGYTYKKGRIVPISKVK